jgi:hypothetical protein
MDEQTIKVTALLRAYQIEVGRMTFVLSEAEALKLQSELNKEIASHQKIDKETRKALGEE